MKKTQQAIISCAVTGSAHTPSMSHYLPVTPDEIAAASRRPRQGRRSCTCTHAIRERARRRPMLNLKGAENVKF